MRKRWLIGFPVLLIAAFVGGYFYFLSSDGNGPEEASDLPVPAGDKDPPLYSRPPSEDRLMQDIHQMTHQKVAAKQKWGALQITQNRIDEMIGTVSSGDYEHGDLYLDILGKWKDGDFTNSVKAHNAIWKLQRGTVGKAKRLSTTDEELKYIRDQFDDKYADVYRGVQDKPGG
ncbi:DUF6241 domain-containing protein [Bhargavaea ullalensis]